MLAHSHRILSTLVVVCLVGLPAFADQYYWINPNGGNFNAAANWDNNPEQPGTGQGVPGSGDLAVFTRQENTFLLDLATPYTVTIGGAQQVNRFAVRNDTVIFNVTGSLTTFGTGETNSCPIGIAGMAGNLTITGGGVVDASSIGKVDIAMGADSTGSLTVSNGTLLATQFSVGAGGDGTLLIESGGAVQNVKGIIGSYENAVGRATVDGGSWESSGIFVVGWDNKGYLTAQNGATLTQADGKDAYLGYSVGSRGVADVTGASTTWTVGDKLKIGDEGFGDLTVSNKATVTAQGVLLGASATGRGTADITGAGTALNVENQLKIGNEGIGDMTISDQATVTAPGVLLGASATGVGFATIDGGKLLTDNLVLGGNLSESQGTGLMTIKKGAVAVTGETRLWNNGFLNLQGGTLTTDTVNFSDGAFGWTGGTLEVSGAGGLKIGPGYDLDSVTLSSGKTLNVTNTLVVKEGGTLTLDHGIYQAAALRINGGVINTTDIAINLNRFHSLVGNGSLVGEVKGDDTVVITANGDLTMGDSDSVDGYDVEGELNVGSYQVTLLDSNRALLGVTTTIDDDGVLTGLNGLRLDAGETLTADGNAKIKGNFYNDGAVNGPTNVNKKLSFNDDVTGGGSYSGNIEFTKGFTPGNSPGAIEFSGGNVSFGENATLVMEILGLASDQYDQLLSMGLLDFNGKLLLDFGFTPDVGTTFNLLDFASFTGSFDDIEILGLDPASLDCSQLATQGTISVVPEPGTLSLLATLGLSLAAKKRRRQL
ncbi:MAG: PEP-CTERM sorting domain-containing protein [Phycisphaerae bacterium]|nr:PEP-CTERM sorting domain-containing protein [Phycisphaerae bacterium]